MAISNRSRRAPNIDPNDPKMQPGCKYRFLETNNIRECFRNKEFYLVCITETGNMKVSAPTVTLSPDGVYELPLSMILDNNMCEYLAEPDIFNSILDSIGTSAFELFDNEDDLEY